MKSPINCLRFILFALVFSILWVACQKDDIPSEDAAKKISDTTKYLNNWVYDDLSVYYLWNSTLPAKINPDTASNTKTFFNSLLNSADKWSWITDDYEALSNEFAGTPVSMGYEPAFYLFNNSTNVFIVVKYVYPNTPAAKAGLKRGDIILTINGQSMTSDNYYDLYSKTSYTVGLGTYSGGGISLSGKTLSMTAETITTNPVLYHTIFDLNGTKIGYLVYTEFITGKSNEYLDSIAKVINKFKVANVREMIVDLRYNPGGEIDAAVYLASALAPQSATSSKSTLISLKYNSLLQTEFDSNKSKYADYLGYNFLNATPNMNLSRVYFLTTNRTASASELVISGLMAYMDVSIIGENTYGKYVGAWVIPSDKYNWAMVPIVMKYSNANGYSNFDNGLPPNYLIDDNLLEAVPFGDASDPMVAKAIGLITGSPVAVAQTKSAYILPGKPIVSAKEKLRSNLILPLPQNRLTQ